MYTLKGKNKDEELVELDKFIPDDFALLYGADYMAQFWPQYHDFELVENLPQEKKKSEEPHEEI